MQMERWLLEFPANMRKAALQADLATAQALMQALSEHYLNRSQEKRRSIFLSLAHTIMEELDHDSQRQVEDFLLEIGLLQQQKA